MDTPHRKTRFPFHLRVLVLFSVLVIFSAYLWLIASPERQKARIAAPAPTAKDIAVVVDEVNYVPASKSGAVLFRFVEEEKKKRDQVRQGENAANSVFWEPAPDLLGPKDTEKSTAADRPLPENRSGIEARPAFPAGQYLESSKSGRIIIPQKPDPGYSYDFKPLPQADVSPAALAGLADVPAPVSFEDFWEKLLNTYHEPPPPRFGGSKSFVMDSMVMEKVWRLFDPVESSPLVSQGGKQADDPIMVTDLSLELDPLFSPGIEQSVVFSELSMKLKEPGGRPGLIQLAPDPDRIFIPVLPR